MHIGITLKDLRDEYRKSWNGKENNISIATKAVEQLYYLGCLTKNEAYQYCIRVLESVHGKNKVPSRFIETVRNKVTELTPKDTSKDLSDCRVFFRSELKEHKGKNEIKRYLQIIRRTYLKTALTASEVFNLAIECMTEVEGQSTTNEHIETIRDFLKTVESNVKSHEKPANDQVHKFLETCQGTATVRSFFKMSMKDLEIIRLQELKPMSPIGGSHTCPF